MTNTAPWYLFFSAKFYVYTFCIKKFHNPKSNYPSKKLCEYRPMRCNELFRCFMVCFISFVFYILKTRTMKMEYVLRTGTESAVALLKQNSYFQNFNLFSSYCFCKINLNPHKICSLNQLAIHTVLS